MKKLFFILVAMFVAFQATSQEFLKVEDVTYVKCCTLEDHGGFFSRAKCSEMNFPRAILSDGTVLAPFGSHIRYGYIAKSPGGKMRDIKTNLTNITVISLKQGDLIYHTGDYYWYEYKKPQKQVVIKTVNIRRIEGAYQGSIQGDFAYNSFLAFVSLLGGGGRGKAKGSLSGSFQGGAYTVANVTFTDGTHTSILMTQDGFWYEAKPGMKVNVSKLRDATIYELL